MAKKIYLPKILDNSKIEKMTKRITGKDEIVYEKGFFKHPIHYNSDHVGSVTTTNVGDYASITLNIGDRGNPSWLTKASTDLNVAGLCSLLNIKEDVNNVISNGPNQEYLEDMAKKLTETDNINYGKGKFNGNIVVDSDKIGNVEIGKLEDNVYLGFIIGEEHKPDWETVISTKIDAKEMEALKDIREKARLAQVFSKAETKYKEYEKLISDNLTGLEKEFPIFPVGFMS